jgi:predicted DCC family thiol-disulfide oxidoreductase YuxK
VDRLLVIYDADCGVCQTSIGWLERRDRHGRFELRGNDGELPEGVSREETEHTLVVLEGARKWTRGGAVARLLRELRGWSVVARALRAPGIGWLVDRGYDKFARNRHRISTWLGLTSCPAPRRPPPST